MKNGMLLVEFVPHRANSHLFYPASVKIAEISVSVTLLRYLDVIIAEQLEHRGVGNTILLHQLRIILLEKEEGRSRDLEVRALEVLLESADQNLLSFLGTVGTHRDKLTASAILVHHHAENFAVAHEELPERNLLDHVCWRLKAVPLQPACSLVSALEESVHFVSVLTLVLVREEVLKVLGE